MTANTRLFGRHYRCVDTGDAAYCRASDILRKKNQNFAGFSGANSWKNRPISRDFSGKNSNFEGFSGANS